MFIDARPQWLQLLQRCWCCFRFLRSSPYCVLCIYIYVYIFASSLAHFLVMPYDMKDLDQHWFRECCYLKQCWLTEIFSRIKVQQNLNQNKNISIEENKIENVCKMAAFFQVSVYFTQHYYTHTHAYAHTSNSPTSQGWYPAFLTGNPGIIFKNACKVGILSSLVQNQIC